MSKSILHIFFLLTALFSCAACSDKMEEYPSLLMEYITAETGDKGTVTGFTTDKGRFYSVSEDKTGKTFTRDSTLRLITYYEFVASSKKDTTACLYAAAAAVSPVPKQESEFKGGIYVAPADILSIWMGKEYLNVVLNILAQDKTHTFGFIEQSRTTDEKGRTIVSLMLYHDDNNDTMAYTKRIYLSIPLKKYIDGSGNDIIVSFSLHTYNNSVKTYTLTYSPS